MRFHPTIRVCLNALYMYWTEPEDEPPIARVEFTGPDLDFAGNEFLVEVLMHRAFPALRAIGIREGTVIRCEGCGRYMGSALYKEHECES